MKGTTRGVGSDALFECDLLPVDKGKIKVGVDPVMNDRVRAWVENVDSRFSTARRPGRIPYFRWHAKQKPSDLSAAL